jgi:MbtH protein
MSWGDENTIFNVVINHEEQFSIWPDYKDLPAGWTAVGKRGKKDECLAYIDEVWTDMRPRSLRLAMAEDDARNAARVAGPATV